jgi:hypothetical protein
MENCKTWKAEEEEELMSRLDVAERFAMELEKQLLQRYITAINDLYVMRANYGQETDIVDTVEDILERAKRRARSEKSDPFSGLLSKPAPR